jgi:hypothetical protein
VHAGPTCPVQQVNASPCERLVVSATIAITRVDQSAVTTVVSDSSGHFHLDLSPGTYIFTPQPVEGLMGTARPMTVEVVAGSDPPPLDVAYDTGIR